MARFWQWRPFRSKRELNCNEVRELASDYVDGGSPEKTVEKVQRHLSWCGPCAAFVATLTATISALRNLPSHPGPEGLKERLRQAAQRHRS